MAKSSVNVFRSSAAKACVNVSAPQSSSSVAPTSAIDARLIERLRGRRVYLTMDVDGLDPAIIPATGTPEPDGLTWPETLDIIRTVAQTASIVGLDCVELAPVAGLHTAEFAAAKLVYKAMSYAVGSRGK